MQRPTLSSTLFVLALDALLVLVVFAFGYLLLSILIPGVLSVTKSSFFTVGFLAGGSLIILSLAKGQQIGNLVRLRVYQLIVFSIIGVIVLLFVLRGFPLLVQIVLALCGTLLFPLMLHRGSQE